MKRILLPLCAPFILIAVSTNTAYSQTSTNTAGGDAQGAGGSAAYSVGLVDYISESNDSGAVDQGVQHAYEILTLSTNETELDISALVFPNPTSEMITIKLSGFESLGLSYHLSDIQGKILNKGVISNSETQVDMSNLPVSTYFVTILNKNNQRVETFKIIKK